MLVSGWRCGLLLAAALGAAGAVLSTQPATAQTLSIVDEVKLGVLDHDAHFAGGKEKGIDINPEILFRSPVDDALASTVPPYLRWMMQPRPHIGGEINTSHYTNQAYFGLTWTWLLARGLLSPFDGLNFGYSFGPSFNDGDIVAHKPDRKSLGSHVLFRESFELGYMVTPQWEVSAFFDHVSNGGLAKENQSINDAGLRLGFKF